MANEQNLIPFSERSESEARENGKKGGRASGASRRRKSDLRKIAQTILDGTYQDKNGKDFTVEELITKGIIANLGNPNGKNWAKAMDLLIELTGASQTPEQKAKTKAETQLAKAKAKILMPDKASKTADDNFLEALNGSAADDWEDNDDGGIEDADDDV